MPNNNSVFLFLLFLLLRCCLWKKLFSPSTHLAVFITWARLFVVNSEHSESLLFRFLLFVHCTYYVHFAVFVFIFIVISFIIVILSIASSSQTRNAKHITMKGTYFAATLIGWQVDRLTHRDHRHKHENPELSIIHTSKRIFFFQFFGKYSLEKMCKKCAKNKKKRNLLLKHQARLALNG